MQAKGAMRWFEAFLLATTVAVAAGLGLSELLEATLSSAPTVQPRIESAEAGSQSGPRLVTLEPERIEVIARRTAVRGDVRAERSPGHRRPG